MEYWTGWFDNWGGPHYVFDADGECHIQSWKNDIQLFQIFCPAVTFALCESL